MNLVSLKKQTLDSYLNPISLSFDELDPVPAKKKLENAQTAAAVLIAITEHSSNPEVIFTRRADHLNSHRGQVSFPGGRWESDDADLRMTALRESYEEIALKPDLVSIKGCIKPRVSVNGLDVQPYVGLVPNGVSLLANPDEIADIFTVPIKFFKDGQPAYIDCLKRHGRTWQVPVWEFQGFTIWGLTALFTQDLLKRLSIQINTQGVEERRRD